MEGGVRGVRRDVEELREEPHARHRILGSAQEGEARFGEGEAGDALVVPGPGPGRG